MRGCGACQASFAISKDNFTKLGVSCQVSLSSDECATSRYRTRRVNVPAATKMAPPAVEALQSGRYMPTAMTKMFKIALPDGSVKEMPEGSTPADVAAAIGPGLAKGARAAQMG